MTLARTIPSPRRRGAPWLLLVLTATTIGFVVGACGTDGEDGSAGAAGAAGPAGPAGPSGAGGAAGDGGGALPGLGGACTKPCHTFNGVVDQWRFSNHSHPQENEIGGGACGNCHAVDGMQNRLANKYVTAPDSGPPSSVPQGHINYRAANGSVAEIGYGGASAIGRIHCSTCHDFNPTTDPHVTGKYVAGQAPLRVPGGPTDNAFIEKSPDAAAVTGTGLAYGSANTCVFCHKSRKDVTFYISNTANNNLTSVHWGPHEGPQTDIYSGQGGYHFAAKTYGTSQHSTITNKCVSCHMAPVAGNDNVPDHTMKPSLAYCKTCHTTYTGTTFDIDGGQTIVKKALFELQKALNDRGMLTRGETAPFGALGEDELGDGQFHLDEVRPPLSVDGPTAGAVYDYLLVARGKDLGAHNPRYTKQLLWDALEKITGTGPTSFTRPQ